MGFSDSEHWWNISDYEIYERNVNSVTSSPGHQEMIVIENLHSPYTVKGYAYGGGGRKVFMIFLGIFYYIFFSIFFFCISCYFFYIFFIFIKLIVIIFYYFYFFYLNFPNFFLFVPYILDYSIFTILFFYCIY